VVRSTHPAKGDEMMSDKDFDEIEDTLPEVVKSALSVRYGAAPSVPSEIDESILADARRHFEQSGPASLRPARRRKISAWKWTAIASTITAACAAFVVWQPAEKSGEAFTEATKVQDSAGSDVDRNGRVDILDAFALARQMRDGVGSGHDINRDGRFDQLDIELVARESVKL
jgi:hypothetical protein